MADIDFTEPPMAVFTAQPKFAEVDSILAQQLGPTTNPVTTNEQPELRGSPVLPVVNQSNAMPVSSNVVGADINAPTTLVQEFKSTLAVNDINSDISTSAGLPIPQMEPIPKPTPQSKPAPLGESFKNINKLKPKFNSNLAKYISSKEHFGNKPKFNSNLAKFISSKEHSIKNKLKSNSNLTKFISSKEHFGNKNTKKVRVIEHFNSSSVLDNLVLFIVILIGVFYLYTLSPLYHPLDVSMAVSQIPFIGSLTDSGVSDNNKLMIVAGILVAVFVMYKLVK